MPKTMTPSMVELPKYSGSWGSMDSDGSAEKEKGKEVVREKKLPALPDDARKSGAVKVSSYYDDASDEEEARDARSVGVARPSSKRIEYTRKMS